MNFSRNKYLKCQSCFYIVSCQGVVQLGGPDSWFIQGRPTKVEAGKSFLFTESFLLVKIKKTLLILQSHFIWFLYIFTTSGKIQTSVHKRLVHI